MDWGEGEVTFGSLATGTLPRFHLQIRVLNWDLILSGVPVAFPLGCR
jgi:hypothetical protein